MKNITMIAAVGKNLELGKDNDLIWHFKEDMKFFKENTINKPIVMGMGVYQNKGIVGNIGIKAIDWVRKTANEALAESRHFHPTADIRDLAKMARPIVSEGNQTGEGWFLTGEMMELIHDDVPNIVCIQPFGCLPNHIVGKGVIKELRKRLVGRGTDARGVMTNHT